MSKVRILSPRPEINKNTAVDAVFLFILVELWIQTTKSFCRVRIFPSVWCEMRQTCGAFLTICLRLTLGKFTHCRPDQKIQTVAFAAVLLFCLGRADSNDKNILSCSNLSLGFAKKVINLRGIPDNLLAFGTW